MDVNDHGIELRNKAVGMLKAGLTLKKVSENLDISLQSVQMVQSGKTWTILGYITQERTPKNPFSRFQNHHIQDFVQERKIYTIYSTYIG